jgi:hypothetical protein
VVWEGWHREVSPYPDHRRNLAAGARSCEGPQTTQCCHSLGETK